MTLFEKHLGRPMLPSEGLKEREWYVSRILSSKEMDSRRRLMKEETPKQLKLEL